MQYSLIAGLPGRTAIAAGIACAGLAAALPSPAGAHPHVWVTIQTEILSDGSGRVTGLRHKWTFDEFFSAFASQGLDANGDGRLDRQELAALAEENVSSLKHFDYFTFARSGDADIELLDPLEDYYLVHENEQLTLHFTLPLKEPLSPRDARLSYAVYDPTYFVDFAYAEGDPVRLAGNAPAGCRVDVKENTQSATETALSEAFFEGLGADSDFGRQFGRDVVIACDAG